MQPHAVLYTELNIVGINQAVQLNRTWRDLKEKGNLDEETKLFVDARKVVVSPLTRFVSNGIDSCTALCTSTLILTVYCRAIQTSLVGLHTHESMKNGITLSRVIREQKNAGGLDTVGKCIGNEIPERVMSAMAAELMQEEPKPEDKDGTLRAQK